MIPFIRSICILLFLLSGITLIKPRSGWGRLVLFIPKLFTGTFISILGAMGLASAVLGWVVWQDRVSMVIGMAVGIISIRNIIRIAMPSMKLGKELTGNVPSFPKRKMLPSPWIGVWREKDDIPWERDIHISQPSESSDGVLADLWQPISPENRSGLGILYLHGSGWHYADKDFGTRQFFRHLAHQGHVILDLAYTLAPEADLFRMMADVKYSIAWLKTHADELGINPDQAVVMGGSAGGHLALLAGYTPNHSKLDPPDFGDTSVCGVVSYYGPPDLRAQYERFNELPGLTGRTKFERQFMVYLEARFGFETVPVHSLLPSFLGGTPMDVPELYDLGSPINHIGQHSPPTLLLQGMHDFSGAAPEVRRFYHLLKDAECPAYLLELPETEHGFDLYKPKWSPAAQAATYVTDRFLESLARNQ